MHEDTISILMATYNGAAYLAEQIDSLLTQSNQNWVLYIHDDGSSDRTLEIIEAYCNRYPNKIQVISGPPSGGALQNYYYLLQQVSSPYIMFCDQDDIWLPDKIEITYGKMRQAEERSGKDTPVLVFSDLKVVDKDLNLLSERMSYYTRIDPYATGFSHLLVENVVSGCTVMINAALRKLACQVKDTSRLLMHDWWFALIAARFGTIEYIDRAAILYRQHNGNVFGANNLHTWKRYIPRLSSVITLRKSLEKCRMQAMEFQNVYDLKDDPLLTGFVNMKKWNKIRRVLFYKKYGIWCTPLKRNIGMVLFG